MRKVVIGGLLLVALALGLIYGIRSYRNYKSDRESSSRAGDLKTYKKEAAPTPITQNKSVDEEKGARKDLKSETAQIDNGADKKYIDLVNFKKNINNTVQKIIKPNDNKESPSSKKYTVREGDTLYGLAKEFYGDGSKWNLIYEANKSLVKNPEELQVAAVITIPRQSERRAAVSDRKGDVKSNESEDKQKKILKYTIQEGDTLTRIAEEHLGDGDRYEEIIDANEGRISDPDTLHPGKVILVPVKGSE